MLHQSVEVRPRQNGNVEDRAGCDRLLQRRGQPEFDVDSHAMRALEARHELGHQRSRGTAAEDFDRLRKCQ
jgi:hypothetical protein